MKRDQLDSTGAYNLCAAIINHAVRDFNKGTIQGKRSAAAFFTGERCKWMCEAVNATPEDLFKTRLNGVNPHNLNFKKSPPRRRSSPAMMIEWDGINATIEEHAERRGIETCTLRDRINKYGLCKEVFYQSRISKKMMTALGYCNLKEVSAP